MAYVKFSEPPTLGNITPNSGEFTKVGVGAAAVTSGLYVNVTNRISTWITGTNVSTGSDADGLFVDVSFAPSANVTNAASIGLYPTFNPPGGVTITTGYGLYIASGTQGGAGSVTTGYGLFVTSPTFGTSNFAANIGGLIINSGGTGIISSGIWNGTAIDVAHGGTGITTATAYAVLCGGTTSTNPFQSIASVGTSGQILTSNGAGALPTFQAAASSGFTSIVIQTFTGNGTYTPTANMKYCIIEVQGGGGGGGGTAAAGSGGGGGGGGGYARKVVTAATIGVSQSVTVGATANGGSAGDNDGTTGNTSSVGAIVSATGGAKGIKGSTGTGGSGGVGSSGDINLTGGSGGQSSGNGSSTWGTASGGSSFFGSATPVLFGNANKTGSTGIVYGSGGGGGSSVGGNGAGGNGAAGIVVITEYI